jgi:hypothetical protein
MGKPVAPLHEVAQLDEPGLTVTAEYHTVAVQLPAQQANPAGTSQLEFKRRPTPASWRSTSQALKG